MIVKKKKKPFPLRRRLLQFSGMALLVLLVLAGLVLYIDRRVEKSGRNHLTTLDQLASSSDFDCIIVPGALVYEDGRPSAMLKDRLDMAIKIYERGSAKRIIVSGDHGQADYDEVNSMRQYLLDAGIAAEAIFMDHAGFDTYDTLYRAQAVFGVDRAIITTQDFHLYRALYIGEQLGLDIQGVACIYPDWYQSPGYRFREYFARFKAFLDCEVLHASPTYTGPTIPISGDGRTTLG